MLVRVPGWTHPLRAYSADLPAHSSVEQRSQADQLASRIAGLGELAVAAGNWNSWGRADTIPANALDLAPLHLRPARMRYIPQDRTLTPNYDVHDVLASVGLEDAAVLTSRSECAEPRAAAPAAGPDAVYPARPDPDPELRRARRAGLGRSGRRRRPNIRSEERRVGK